MIVHRALSVHVDLHDYTTPTTSRTTSVVCVETEAGWVTWTLWYSSHLRRAIAAALDELTTSAPPPSTPPLVTLDDVHEVGTVEVSRGSHDGRVYTDIVVWARSRRHHLRIYPQP